jgi:MFS family permease
MMTGSRVLAAAPGPTAERPGRRLPRSASFAVIVAIMVLFQAASSAPAPLYVVYQRLWGFSAGTLTLIFAIFVFALLGTLLMAGQLSDYLGRRPVLVAAIAVQAGALVLFLLAGDVTMLLAGRAVQGIATGLVLPALGATLVDFNPAHAPGRAAVVSGVVPVGGLAAGALACSSLVQFAPDPTRLVWIVLLAAMAVALAAVLALPEPAARQPGAVRSLTPRLGIPRRLRREVVALFPVIAASWALGGLYLSLGPSAAVGIFGLTSHFDGGLVVTLLCGTGALTAYALRGAGAAAVLRISAAGLAAGTAVTLAGMPAGSVPAAVAGTIAAGAGYGASGLAAFGSLARLAGPAGPAERSGLFAVAYVVAYLAFSGPALVAGYAATRAGLHATVAVYAVLVIVVAVAALAIGELRPARR